MDANQAFAAAGLDLGALEHKRREAAPASVPSTAKLVEPLRPTHCRCGTPLAPHDGWLCDGCQAALERSSIADVRRQKAQPWHEDWPMRHRNALTSYAGPALEKARELYPKLADGAMLLLYGPPGTGKTGITVWWESQRLAHNLTPGRFMTAQDFFSEVKSSWSTNSETALIRDLRKLRFLVIDEIDERSSSEWENRTLFNLLNHRYNDERATALISNLDEKALLEAYPQKFLDRIGEAGGMVECAWANYRG